MCSVSICRMRRGQTVELPFCCCCCFSCFCLILVNVYFYFGLTTKVQYKGLDCIANIQLYTPSLTLPLPLASDCCHVKYFLKCLHFLLV